MQKSEASYSSVPQVTVLLPTYNRSHLLQRALKSVLAQTYSDYEVIVIDDASTDDTEEVVAEWVKQYPKVSIRYIRNDSNLGARRSRNTGIELAKGKYIASLDDDDIWLPDKLEMQMPYVEEYPIVGCLHAYNHVPSRPDKTVEDVDVRKRSLEELYFSNVGFSPSKFITSKSILEEVGGYDPDLPGPEGLDLAARIIHKYGEGAYVMRILAVHYRDHGLPRITTGDKMIEGCEREFEKNYDLRTEANRKYRRAHIDFMKMSVADSLGDKVSYLFSALSQFDLSHWHHHLRLYRNNLIAPLPGFRLLHRLYWAIKYK